MKKIILLLLTVLLITGCNSNTQNIENKKNTIAVSIVPEENFIEKIVGDEFNIITLIPSGSSPSSHQPSPKQLQELSNADLYFTIGVETEKANILPIISEYENLKIVDIATEIDSIYQPRYFDNNKLSKDPHIWLSPKRAIEIVKIMERELINQYPEYEDIFSSNSKNYISELNILDSFIKEKVTTFDNKDFIIYHPSYGYFADDYGLNMIEIEVEGKNASIDKLNEVIKYAKENNLKSIYYQAEMSSKQAKIIASEINIKTIKLEPLGKNYIESLKFLINSMVGE
ncbi:zinc ABC transporter substrate-binding protein [Clostridiaceae bacterium HSG29]|nr:zinc ABC transporter substrate-binding protein [Clostridiaceae bacterium HSG29]